MEENENYATNIKVPGNDEPIMIRDAGAPRIDDLLEVRSNMELIRQTVDDMISKLSNMAYNLPDDNIDGTPDGKPTAIGELHWDRGYEDN